MDFTSTEVTEIEKGLEQSRPNAWRRIRHSEEQWLSRFGLVAAWRVDMPKTQHLHPLINHVFVGIDAVFPLSDPIVVAPQGVKAGVPYWPHIEPTGKMCLGRLRYSSPVATRVLSSLQDALAVLEMPKDDRDAEHRREFLSYWSQLGRLARMPYLAVMGGDRRSRDIVYSGDAQRGVVFAEDAASLNQWLMRTGRQAPKFAPITKLIWLDEPLLPDAFPKTGRDVVSLAGDQSVDPYVRPGAVLPVLLGCEIDGVPVYACVEIEGISAKNAAKGFRPSKPMPQALVASSFLGRPAVRRSVARADYGWVHGRGRSPDVERLRAKRVAIVGCGALGGFLARSLAQSGVGSLLLIDSEELVPSNVGRHVLGVEAVGRWKSFAMAKRLEADFPHAVSFDAWTVRIEAAKAEQHAELASCDLVIAAGIDLEGELTIDRWRQAAADPPPLVWTWIEEFAAAGHAVGLVDGASLASSLNLDGDFVMRLTRGWPADQAHAVEAGCGVAYQPYSASDMMGTINVAHRLSLDILLGKASANTVCSWLGDREAAVSRGAGIDDAFDRSFSEISRDWRW